MFFFGWIGFVLLLIFICKKTGAFVKKKYEVSDFSGSIK